MLSKYPLTSYQVQHLATTRDRDPALGPTAALKGSVLEVDVVTLSWGLHELLRRLFEDPGEVQRAEHTARLLLGR